MMDQGKVDKLVAMVVRDFKAGLAPLTRTYIRELDPDTREQFALLVKERTYQIIMEL